MTAGSYRETLDHKGLQPFSGRSSSAPSTTTSSEIGRVADGGPRDQRRRRNASCRSSAGRSSSCASCSSPGYAGQLADVHSKRTVLVVTKSLEIVAATLGLVAFAIGRLEITYAVLFKIAMQATFFQPREIRNPSGSAAGPRPVSRATGSARNEHLRRHRRRRRVRQLHVRRVAGSPCGSSGWSSSRSRSWALALSFRDSARAGRVARHADRSQSVARDRPAASRDCAAIACWADGDRHLLFLVPGIAAAACDDPLRLRGDAFKRPLGRDAHHVRGDRHRRRQHGRRPLVRRQGGARPRADRIDRHGRLRDPALPVGSLVCARGHQPRPRRILRRTLCRAAQRVAAAAERRPGKGPPHGDQQLPRTWPRFSCQPVCCGSARPVSACRRTASSSRSASSR